LKQSRKDKEQEGRMAPPARDESHEPEVVWKNAIVSSRLGFCIQKPSRGKRMN
jgi:hypothetical protein